MAINLMAPKGTKAIVAQAEKVLAKLEAKKTKTTQNQGIQK